MDRELLPVGSIVAYDNIRAMINGYFFDREEEKPVLKYLLIPYPVGMIDDDVLVKCDTDSVELIYKGYTTDMSESFGNYLMFMYEYLKDHSETELFELITQEDEEVSL